MTIAGSLRINALREPIGRAPVRALGGGTRLRRLSLCFHFALIIFGWKGGPLTQLVSLVASSLGLPLIWKALEAIVAAALAGLFVQMVVSVQILIFNVYAAFMILGHFTASSLKSDSESESAAPTRADAAVRPTTTTEADADELDSTPPEDSSAGPRSGRN